MKKERKNEKKLKKCEIPLDFKNKNWYTNNGKKSTMKYEVFAMKMSTVWKILAAIAAVAALCVVGVKLYQKFVKKKEEAIDEAEETDAIEAPEAEVEETVAEEEAFEVPAEAVIANAEDMEETPAE